MLTLLPLAQSELAPSQPHMPLEQRLWRGGYPALHALHRLPEPPHWFAGYVATYVERDVRQLLNVSNLLTFQRFLSMCAARSGQLLNLNSLASDCGISQPTARQWLTVLQASHIVALVPPYHRNFGKRQVKTPKLYFLDSGLLCHLLRIASPADLQVHAARAPCSRPGSWPRRSSTGTTRRCRPISTSGATTTAWKWTWCLNTRAACMAWSASRHHLRQRLAQAGAALARSRGCRSGRPAAGLWRRQAARHVPTT
jgi:hypothetical protein